ncbi:MAG: bacteriochlorophyllide d C-20 methyltransferase BchU [Acidobacteriota bacterium]
MSNPLPAAAERSADVSEETLYEQYVRACDMTYRGTVDLFVLKAAYELGLFHHLAEQPQSVEALAAATGSRLNRLVKFTDMLVDMDLLAKEAEGRLALTPFARQFFLPPNPSNENLTMEPFVRYAVTIMERYHLHLAKVIRGEMDFTALTPWPPKTREDSAFYEEIHRSNNYFIRNLLVEEADLAGVAHLLDVGGGNGDIAIALAKRFPSLERITLINLPSALDIVRDNVAAHGLAERILPVALDMYRDPYPACDAVLFARILYPFNAQVCAMLLGKAQTSLSAGGRVIIADMLLRDERGLPNYDYLAHFLTSVGVDPAMMTFKRQDEYFDILQSLGFVEARKVERYGQVLYQARKP